MWFQSSREDNNHLFSPGCSRRSVPRGKSWRRRLFESTWGSFGYPRPDYWQCCPSWSSGRRILHSFCGFWGYRSRTQPNRRYSGRQFRWTHSTSHTLVRRETCGLGWTTCLPWHRQGIRHNPTGAGRNLHHSPTQTVCPLCELPGASTLRKTRGGSLFLEETLY